MFFFVVFQGIILSLVISFCHWFLYYHKTLLYFTRLNTTLHFTRLNTTLYFTRLNTTLYFTRLNTTLHFTRLNTTFNKLYKRETQDF